MFKFEIVFFNVGYFCILEIYFRKGFSLYCFICFNITGNIRALVFSNAIIFMDHIVVKMFC